MFYTDLIEVSSMLTDKERAEFEMDPLIKLCFDYIYPITQDRVLATHGGSISLIDKQGIMLATHDSIELGYYDFDPPEEDVSFDEDGNPLAQKSVRTYIDDILIIRDDGLYGLMDLDGEILVEPCYDRLEFAGPDEIIVD